MPLLFLLRCLRSTQLGSRLVRKALKYSDLLGGPAKMDAKARQRGYRAMIAFDSLSPSHRHNDTSQPETCWSRFEAARFLHLRDSDSDSDSDSNSSFFWPFPHHTRIKHPKKACLTGNIKSFETSQRSQPMQDHRRASKSQAPFPSDLISLT